MNGKRTKVKDRKCWADSAAQRYEGEWQGEVNERDKDQTNNQLDWERWGEEEREREEEDSAGREGIMVSFNSLVCSAT